MVQMGTLAKARRGRPDTVPLSCWCWEKLRLNAHGWDLMGFAEPAQAWDQVWLQSGSTLGWGCVCCSGSRERTCKACGKVHGAARVPAGAAAPLGPFSSAAHGRFPQMQRRGMEGPVCSSALCPTVLGALARPGTAVLRPQMGSRVRGQAQGLDNAPVICL